MEPTVLAFVALVWHGSTEIASGAGLRGPWQQNESRYDFVDDPAVAIAEDGAAAVAWVDQASKDVWFGRQGEAVNVSRSPATFSWLPRIAVSGTRVFVLWQEIIFAGGSHGGDMLFARSEDGGKTFSAPVNLSESIAGDGKGRVDPQHWDNGSYDLALGPDGTLHVAWTEYEGRLWFRRSSDGGRTFSDKLSIGGEKPARAPALAAHGGNVYLAWTVGDDRRADVRVAKSVDGGATFGAPVLAAKSASYSDAPKLAVDNQGVLHLVYAEGRRIVHARSHDGERFERPGALSSEPSGFPDLRIDGQGRVVVLWELFREDAHRPRGLAIAVSSNNGYRFRVQDVPQSAGTGWNGSSQGLLMRKLAVGADGALAVVNSSLKPDEASRIWLVRGQLER